MIQHREALSVDYINSFDTSSCSLVSMAKWLLERTLDLRDKRCAKLVQRCFVVSFFLCALFLMHILMWFNKDPLRFNFSFYKIIDYILISIMSKC